MSRPGIPVLQGREEVKFRLVLGGPPRNRDERRPQAEGTVTTGPWA